MPTDQPTARTAWKKEKPYKGVIHQGCLNCPPVERLASMDMIIAVGFGSAYVMKDDKCVYSEDEVKDSDYPTLRRVENKARKDPDHDWRVVLEAPLRSREYQRQGKNEWVLIRSGQGFA